MATLDFKGKALVQNYHLTVKYHELVPKKDKSLTDKVRLDDNLIIHGDNLKALKALLPTYAGRVKCIYVDAPYNTGNEGWVYNDNVNSPMIQEWLGKTVDRDDLTRHDKWLCMMMPRLKLLRELLSNDGVIFASIDNIETHHMRMLMDEVFQGHFVGTFIWRKKEGGGQTDDYFVTEHEYVQVYAKSEEFEWLDESIPLEEADFNKSDKEGKFVAVKLAKWGSGARREDRPKMYFPLEAPDGTNVYPKTPDGRAGRWRVGKARADLLVENDLMHWEKKGDTWVAYEKVRFEEGKARKIKERSILFDLATTGDATNTLTDIFGKKDVFENPKPFQMVKLFIERTTAKDSIVLDSFAGSGTTAHATLALNKEDGGNRKFILVECEDYADEITAERVRRVIKGVRGASDEDLKKGLGGTFSYFELGKPIELESILDGKNLPSYLELARYVFYTATGEEFDERKMNEKRQFVGESKNHEVYLFYKPDIDHLKKTALTLERAEELGKPKANGKRRLVFAPTKYLDQEQLDALRIDFAQLPFEIYKLAR
ncbi:MAG: site-specific DNA-methyltransferase [Verrucomicrobia bacterium]|nr:site-specific DNA-methyltransferase [Verrucomicrobiota bacterium]